jgi:hypothetical protein
LKPKDPRINQAAVRKYYATHRRQCLERLRKYRAENRPKTRAQWLLGAAVKCGRVVRKPCEVCGNPKSHGHHDDYSKPLKVRWLCARHHNQHHREQRKNNGNRSTVSSSVSTQSAAASPAPGATEGASAHEAAVG